LGISFEIRLKKGTNKFLSQPEKLVRAGDMANSNGVDTLTIGVPLEANLMNLHLMSTGNTV